MKITHVNSVNKPELYKAYQNSREELKSLAIISIVLISYLALT